MLHNRLRGRDLHAPTNELVENNTASIITKLKVVRLTGMGVHYPQIALADPNIYVNFGVVHKDIAVGDCGLVCALGFMFEVDTSPWAPMTLLYSDASGNLTTTPLGGIVAQVIKQDATDGVLYVAAEQANEINAVSWLLEGNNGTNPSINFLGTIDNVSLRFRTNNLFRGTIDLNGRFGLGPDITAPGAHFHQKSHTGYANSGLRQETFSLKTSAATSQVLYAVPINNNSVVKVEISVVGRISDGSGRAAFKRTGLFYREMSNVQAQRIWQTDFTDKSDPAFDISYTVGVNTLTISVKSSVSTDTYWTGSVKIESVETDV